MTFVKVFDALIDLSVMFLPLCLESLHHAQSQRIHRRSLLEGHVRMRNVEAFAVIVSSANEKIKRFQQLPCIGAGRLRHDQIQSVCQLVVV
eukprot:Skav234766  [mRNA]  locus=scaffold2396:49593:49865:+ [translate_table: standard]